uniref:Uncharacterized protein n=1 Tax=Helicotheca tamesis TaxID=374047 RepID=A0A7S2MUR9_9STRA
MTVAFTSDYPSTTADQLMQITAQVIKTDIDVLATLPEVARTCYLDPPENLAPLATSSSSTDEKEERSAFLFLMGFYGAATVGLVFLFVYKGASNNRRQRNNEHNIGGKEQVADTTMEASEYGDLKIPT